ncbi:CDP-alcohol phosphatidyltransferase family protein [Geobacter sp.]|uniref:CDP-alcohol phosphatidyltransferase family protein n=1 Tax=Geobacter sp. TaxID=46610 RepID=UPI0027B99087|nr:CDP-alcohol phosphatidyltransferase family protein [Geobacter sp.]
MIANIITLSRLVLLYVTLYIVSLNSLSLHIWALLLTFVLMVFDALDGMAARHFNVESEFGSVFDIVMDRIVESCYWIFFATRGVIPVAIPIIIISRGFVTDGIRSVALAQGMTAFGERSMQKTRLGRFIVTSRLSRGMINFLKILSFLMLILLDALNLPNAGGLINPDYHTSLRGIGIWTVYVTVAFCVIRGLPVIYESQNLIFPKENNEA